MLILKPNCPAESSVRLVNPERGFYALFKAELLPCHQDMRAVAEGIFTPDEDDLLLCEISLRHFADAPVSREGLRQLEELLSALSDRGGSLIIRFLYDWEGQGLSSEPSTIETIIGHIHQLGPVVRAFSNHIFLHQGLFTGSWGEMHDTNYSSPDDMERLLAAQREAFGPDILLCVRTIGQLKHLEALGSSGRNIGLYNDGMMGSSSDLGSYASDDCLAGREEALELQSSLCLHVPNGGEVIYNPRYSELAEAFRTLKRMRVSYLNRYHDLRALDQWSRTRIADQGIWHGMDGLNYIERHLGYRYVIRDVAMAKSFIKKTLRLKVAVANVGFAPIYHRLSAMITLCQEDSSAKTVPGILCGIEGGIPVSCKAEISKNDRSRTGTGESNPTIYTSDIKLSGLAQGRWQLYFRLWSEKYDREIFMGNKRAADFGYPIGGFEIK